MAFNIESLKLVATTELHLKHPVTQELLYDTDKNGNDDETKPVVAHLYGKASKQHKKAVEVLLKKKKDRKGREATLTEGIVDNAEFLASLSAKIDNMDFNGAPVDSQEVFVELYKDPAYSWLADMVAATVGDVEAFLTK